LGKKKGLSGRQYKREASFITWKMELSIGGATEPGNGFK
jgi:hypothetical protein